jgi:SAM-dependent methyltransferase
MGNINWREFWQTYRRVEVKNERDLFFEVGKTVNQKPIPKASFRLSIELVARELKLCADDRLLELCCGNGLITLPLSSLVGEIQAVDFSAHLVENARRFRQAPNITYICADAIDYIADLAASRSYVPSKILLGEALGYFESESLSDMLRSARKLTNNQFIFLATGIPSDELKRNFYNTSERVRRYNENQQLAANTNDGIGRWWRREELESIGRDLDLIVSVTEQPHALSNFRIDVIFNTRN